MMVTWTWNKSDNHPLEQSKAGMARAAGAKGRRGKARVGTKREFKWALPMTARSADSPSPRGPDSCRGSFSRSPPSRRPRHPALRSLLYDLRLGVRSQRHPPRQTPPPLASRTGPAPAHMGNRDRARDFVFTPGNSRGAISLASGDAVVVHLSFRSLPRSPSLFRARDHLYVGLGLQFSHARQSTLKISL
jgi:hypothetical protein